MSPDVIFYGLPLAIGMLLVLCIWKLRFQRLVWFTLGTFAVYGWYEWVYIPANCPAACIRVDLSIIYPLLAIIAIGCAIRAVLYYRRMPSKKDVG